MYLYFSFGSAGSWVLLWAVAGCGEQGRSLLQSEGFSPQWLFLLGAGSIAVEHGFSCSTHAASPWTRSQTRVPCFGRQVL